MERFWTLLNGELRLLDGRRNSTLVAHPCGGGNWKGRWLVAEQMPISLFRIELPDPVNEREYNVLALRRSGHHAIVAWLLSMMEGDWVYCNDVRPGQNPFSAHSHYNYFPRSNSLAFDLSFEEAGAFSKKDSLVISTENCHVSEWLRWNTAEVVGRSRMRTGILVLRDPYNNWASLNCAAFPPELDFSSFVSLWKEHARWALDGNGFVIIYNQWIASEDYNRQLADQLKLNYRPPRSGHIPRFGYGSSFEGIMPNRDATRFNQRWKRIEMSPEMRNLMMDNEIIGLMRKLFAACPVSGLMK